MKQKIIRLVEEYFPNAKVFPFYDPPFIRLIEGGNSMYHESYDLTVDGGIAKIEFNTSISSGIWGESKIKKLPDLLYSLKEHIKEVEELSEIALDLIDSIENRKRFLITKALYLWIYDRETGEGFTITNKESLEEFKTYLENLEKKKSTIEQK